MTLGTALAAVCIVAVGVYVARLLAGPSAEISRRWELLLFRGLVLVLIAVLLLNPVGVEESPGVRQRPEVFYLLDSSASMTMGGEETRWDEVLRIIRETEKQTDAHARVGLYRFGHWLSSVAETDAAENGRDEPGFEDVRSQQARLLKLANVEPIETDTRLAPALRQLTSRFGRTPPASIVLFSDGRARDEAAIDDPARFFRKLGVPIHTVPVGDTARGGDIAIVAVVVPETVRRQSQVEVQVFLRSFGYEGRRVEVQLRALDETGTAARSLSSPQPVTLQGGVQSLSLSFYADLETRRLAVSVTTQSDEISSTNNSMTAETFVDRTKIRVLYVEGSEQSGRPVRRGGKVEIRGPDAELRDALIEDKDIECVALSAAFGRILQVGPEGNVTPTHGFPTTSAELSAYDMVILSNVAREMFSDEQIDWLERLVSERGGGLCMLGGPSSFASGNWRESKLGDVLPVVMQDDDDWDSGAEVKGVVKTPSKLHPIWNILPDAKRNRLILAEFPEFEGANRGLRLKPGFSSSLVDASLAPGTSGGGAVAGILRSLTGVADVTPKTPRGTFPMIAVGRYGRGRTMAMAPAITAPWANAFLNDWGDGNSRYYTKFWRNAVYWLTENSSIGRRRLVASHDKRFYKPGDTLSFRAVAYDEGAHLTEGYRIIAMIEPQSAEFDPDSLYSPVRWPNGLQRTSGEEGPFIAWGEEFALPKLNATTAGVSEGSGYGLELQIAEALSSGAADVGLRIELTAYEDSTQVDSTSMEVQVMHDPFEHQNPFPNHQLLKKIAALSGGEVLKDGDALARMINDLPVQIGAPIVRKSPMWSRWWVLAVLIGLLTIEWFWRRSLGLA